MTHRDDLDLMLSAWLDDPYTPPAPGYLGEVLERTRRTRQRPAWASLERWLPMVDKIARPALAPPLRIALLLLVALLLVAFAVGIAVLGSRLLNPTPQVYDVPRGGAAVFAFGSMEGSLNGDQTGGHIFTVRADGTNMRQLTNGKGIESHPVFSPDGTRIAYREWLNGSDSVMVVDGSGTTRSLATIALDRMDCRRAGQVWSPDGSSLLFWSSAACNGDFDLFIVASDGSSPATKLLAPGTTGLNASWSPDGKRIAFLGRDAAATSGVYIVDVGPNGALPGGLQSRRIGSGPTSLFTDVSSGPRWSPDGTKLAFINDADALVIANADGSGQRVVIQNVDFFTPSWSPNGRRLAFYRTVDPPERFEGRPCTIRLWIVDAAGTNERRFDPLGDGCDFPPMWSPDGTLVAYNVIQAKPDAPFQLSVVAVDGGGSVVTLPDTNTGTWQPFLAPLPRAASIAPTSPAP